MKDGKQFNASITLSPVCDSHGEITAISVTSRDITEKKMAEEKLRESEEKYRSIVETANEGIVIINEEFKAIFINEKMADMVGHSLKECLNKPMSDFISGDCVYIVKDKFENRPHKINKGTEFIIRFTVKEKNNHMPEPKLVEKLARLN